MAPDIEIVMFGASTISTGNIELLLHLLQKCLGRDFSELQLNPELLRASLSHLEGRIAVTGADSA